MTDTRTERPRVARGVPPGRAGSPRAGAGSAAVPRQPARSASGRPSLRAVSGTGRSQSSLATRPGRATQSAPPAARPVSPRPAVQRQPASRAPGTRTGAGAPIRQAGTRPAVPRMPFVLLVLALLGGGLICLLVINTTLGAASFRISQLQKTGASLSTQEQSLQEQVAEERAPAEIAKLAYQLGMRVQATTHILDLRTHQTDVLAGQAGVDANLGASPAGTASPGASSAPTSQTSPKPAGTPQPTGSASPTPAGSPAGSTQ